MREKDSKDLQSLSVRGEGGEWESGEGKTVQYGGHGPHKNYWYLNDLFFTHRHLIELDIIHCTNNNNKKMNRRSFCRFRMELFGVVSTQPIGPLTFMTVS